MIKQAIARLPREFEYRLWRENATKRSYTNKLDLSWRRGRKHKYADGATPKAQTFGKVRQSRNKGNCRRVFTLD